MVLCRPCGCRWLFALVPPWWEASALRFGDWLPISVVQCFGPECRFLFGLPGMERPAN